MTRRTRRRGRGVTLGTMVMLACTILVVVWGGSVLMKLKGNSLALSMDKNARQLTDDWSLSLSELPSPDPTANPEPTAAAGLVLVPAATQTPVLTAAATPQPAARTIRLTFGGSLAVQSEVRQSCYYASARSYDFSELFSLIRGRLESDMTCVTLQNLVSGTKYTDLMAPQALLTDLKANRVDLVALGFSKCLDKGGTVLQTTVKEAQAAGLRTTGAFLSESDAESDGIVMVQGVPVAFLHYTDGLNATGLKKLKSAGILWAVAQPDQAAQDIARAKAAGAELVVVSVSWGKAGAKVATANQKALAQKFADAGADVIIGTGSHSVQPVEWLQRADGGRTLCCYGLGNLMTKSRTDEGVAGMLVQLTFTADVSDRFILADACYTPTYLWHYKQDGVWHYRIVDASSAPDGMDAAQEKSMNAARKRVITRLGDNSPLRLYGD